jgi:hypothetical protein
VKARKANPLEGKAVMPPAKKRTGQMVMILVIHEFQPSSALSA